MDFKKPTIYKDVPTTVSDSAGGYTMDWKKDFDEEWDASVIDMRIIGMGPCEIKDFIETLLCKQREELNVIKVKSISDVNKPADDDTTMYTMSRRKFKELTSDSIKRVEALRETVCDEISWKYNQAIDHAVKAIKGDK